MLVRRLFVVLGILVIPAAAYADGHRAGLYGGPSYANGSSLWGFHVAGDYTVGTRAYKYVSLMGDFSTHFGNDVELITASGGLNVSRGQGKFVGNAHALFGVVKNGDSDFATVVGGSLDVVPRRGSGDDMEFGFRVQYDHVLRKGEAKNFHRVTVGISVRWPLTN